MRGDRPAFKSAKQYSLPFTPHARGSTAIFFCACQPFLVYPACAGIDLECHGRKLIRSCLPRMRGDRPFSGRLISFISWFTPHARGSTGFCPSSLRKREVYPACAGIDLGSMPKYFRQSCLPRMRGDRPIRTSGLCQNTPFTPHARGSTYGRIRRNRRKSVYPACAGIDPKPFLFARCNHSLPRMRGDRPVRGCPGCRSGMFTPHARGSTSHTCCSCKG